MTRPMPTATCRRGWPWREKTRGAWQRQRSMPGIAGKGPCRTPCPILSPTAGFSPARPSCRQRVVNPYAPFACWWLVIPAQNGHPWFPVAGIVCLHAPVPRRGRGRTCLPDRPGGDEVVARTIDHDPVTHAVQLRLLSRIAHELWTCRRWGRACGRWCCSPVASKDCRCLRSFGSPSGLGRKAGRVPRGRPQTLHRTLPVGGRLPAGTSAGPRQAERE